VLPSELATPGSKLRLTSLLLITNVCMTLVVVPPQQQVLHTYNRSFIPFTPKGLSTPTSLFCYSKCYFAALSRHCGIAALSWFSRLSDHIVLNLTGFGPHIKGLAYPSPTTSSFIDVFFSFQLSSCAA